MIWDADVSRSVLTATPEAFPYTAFKLRYLNKISNFKCTPEYDLINIK